MIEFDDDDAPPGTTIIWTDSERPNYTEKKLGDEMLAFWETKALPADAIVTRVTLIPYRGERAVLAWRDGRLWLPEGDLEPGEDLDAAITRIAKDQVGILAPTAKHLGHFVCRATKPQLASHDEVTYQALHGVDVSEIADFPADSAFERRMVNQREVNTLLRISYILAWREYRDVLDHFLLERIKASRNKS